VASSQQSGAGILTASASSGFLDFVGQAAKIGSAITVALGISKAVTEWTSAGRKNRAVERAARLASFVDALNKISTSRELSPSVQQVREKAEEEFIQATDRCYPVPSSPPKWRLLLLIYLPPRLLAYIPHFFFFSLCALAGYGIVETVNDILKGTADSSDFFGLVVIGGLICFAQRWAGLEWRHCNGIASEPKRLAFGMSWYPANTFLGLLSNSSLVLGILGLSTLFMPSGFVSAETIVDVLPRWQRVVSVFVGSASIPVSYLWSRAESMLYSGTIRPLSLRDFLRYVLEPQSPERLVGLLAFFFLNVWCVVLLLDLRFVQIATNFPDGSVGTVGIGGAFLALLLVFVLNGLVPWIAAYHGLSDLLDHGRTAPEGAEHDGV
jgi:hypothetical protein